MADDPLPQNAGITAAIVDGLDGRLAATVVNQGSQNALLVTGIGGGGGGGVSEGTYNSTAPALTNGGVASLQLDSSGDLYVNLASLIAGEDLTNNVLAITKKLVIGSTYSKLPFNLTGSASYQLVKSSAGQICSITAKNHAAGLAYIQIYNQGSGAPTGNPIYWDEIPAGTATSPGNVFLDSTFLGENGWNCSSGITVAFSSTQNTYTAVTTPANFSAGGSYF